MKKTYISAILTLFFGLAFQFLGAENRTPPACSVQVMSTNATCSGAANGTAWAVTSGGVAPYTYSWSGTSATTDTITGLTTGSYTVTVTDGSSCVSTGSVTISEPAPLTVTISNQVNVNCFGQCTGTATALPIGGTVNYTYSWTGGPITAGQGTAMVTNLCAGSYTVNVNDANMCSANAVVTITQNTQIVESVTSQTNVKCFGQCNGKATVGTVGGGSSYTYSWSPVSGATATDSLLCAASYTVNVMDNFGCPGSVVVTITSPTQITPTILSHTNLLCNGRCRGTAVVGVTGGTGTYSYAWAPAGGTKDTATRLCAGTSTVTITDANGCVKLDSVTLTQPSALATVSTQKNEPCNGSSLGSASVSTTGGTAPYTYSWVPTAVPTGLKAGPEICFLTDSNGCKKTIPFNITQPAVIKPVISVKPASCPTCLDGRDSVNTTGGTGTFTYSWSPGTCTSPICTGLAAGTYTCCVTDSAGCSICQTATVGVTGILEIDAPVMYIYPNPAGALLNIQVPAQLEIGTLSVFNAVGALVKEIKTFKSSTLDISGMVPGTYILRLDYSGGSMHKLFIKQ